MNVDKFHKDFDAIADDLLGPSSVVRETLLEGAGTCSREEILGQLMMENLFPHDCDVDNCALDDMQKGVLTREQKVFLIGVADHMGPDFCQALYHAAVFMTRVV